MGVSAEPRRSCLGYPGSPRASLTGFGIFSAVGASAAPESNAHTAAAPPQPSAPRGGGGVRAAPGSGDGTTRECGAGRPAAVKYAGGAAAVTHPPPAIPRRSPPALCEHGAASPSGSTPRRPRFDNSGRGLETPARAGPLSERCNRCGGRHPAARGGRTGTPGGAAPCSRARPLFGP